MKVQLGKEKKKKKMEILLLLDRRSDTFFSGTCVVQVECVNALDGEMKQKGMDPKR